jgi:hypothetical protein
MMKVCAATVGHREERKTREVSIKDMTSALRLQVRKDAEK